MIDRIFAAVLTFCLLIGGTLAIGAAMLGRDQPAAASVRTVHLQRVVVTARRDDPAFTRVAETEAPVPAARLQ